MKLSIGASIQSNYREFLIKTIIIIVKIKIADGHVNTTLLNITSPVLTVTTCGVKSPPAVFANNSPSQIKVQK